MDPNNESQEPQEMHASPTQKPRAGFWARIGGGALSIAILIHVVVLIVGGLIIFQYVRPSPVPEPPLQGGQKGGSNRSPSHEMQQKRQTQAAREVRRVLIEEISNTVTVKKVEDLGSLSSLPSLSNGAPSSLSGAGLGPGWGPGSGNHHGLSNGPAGAMGLKSWQLIPEQMRKRCSKEDRLQRLKENGGTPQCDESVAKGLDWLKEHQNPDGSWGSTYKVAMTGFALLSYFGHCETTESVEFGNSCMKGIVYLVNTGLRNQGRLAENFSSNQWCYEHAIGTYALGEAATFSKDLKREVPSLMEITRQAGQYIIENQNSNGGWAYGYERSEGHVDVSVTGWQIQALKACEHSGLKFTGISSAINQSLRYLNKCQNKNGGYGYTGETPAGDVRYFTLTGVGMFCNQMWGKGEQSEVRKAAKYIVHNSKFNYNSENADLYGHYYESQAMMQCGGEDWKFYNSMFRDQLLENQNEDGSWKSPGGGKKINAVGAMYVGDSAEAVVYRTSLCTLMLEVYYRFLSTGGSTSKLGI